MMKTYMWTTIICLPITLLSLGAAIWFNCFGNDFVSNIMLAAFGSSLLTLIGSIVGYFVVRHEAIGEYLTALRTYRMKYRRFVSCMPGKERDQKFEDLQDCFYDSYTVYSKIQHICKSLCKYKKIPRTLNKSFELTTDVQGALNCNGTQYKKYSEDIDRAVQLIEGLVIKKKNPIPTSQIRK